MSIQPRNIPNILSNALPAVFDKTVVTLLIAVFFVLWGQPSIAGDDGDSANVAAERSFRFTYHTEIRQIPDSARSLQAFIPVPVSGKHQTISNVEVICAYDHTFERDDGYGNKLLALQINGSNLPRRIPVTLSFDVHRQAVLQASDYATSIDNRSLHLGPDSLIPFDKKIRAEAERVTEPGMSTSEMASAFYDRLVNTMEYDKSGQGWGRGDALFACDNRKGNCTDFHSLFIGMSRVREIPSRFEIGFPLPADQQEGSIGGYHCWASFHEPEKGWVPVDISEAWKYPEKKSFYFGSLDANRVLFTVGRDIPLPIKNGKDIRLNYFIYPHVRVNGQSHDAVKTEFSFRDL